MDQDQTLAEIHQKVTIIHTVLLGVPGTEDGGLVRTVADNKVCLDDLRSCHDRLRKSVYIGIGILLGSGLLGAGIWGLIEGVRGG